MMSVQPVRESSQVSDRARCAVFVKGLSRGFGVLIVWAGMASGQTMPTAARIESVPLELTMPERYQVTELLEPIRRVTLIAPADGFVRRIEFRLGALVRESQEIAQLDRNEASARVKVAAAEVKEKEAQLKAAGAASPSTEIFRSQLDAARAWVELAEIALDRCTLRAPFAGQIVALPVSAGQYVVKGTTIAELADISALKTLLPVDRRSVSSGAAVTVQVEGQDVAGKVQAILPLPQPFAALRELATPFAAAWVVVPNTKGELEPGLRVSTTTVPAAPITTVAKRAVKAGSARDTDGTMVQVIRNEYVTNIPVRVLGDTGPERTQITGLFRRTDALIVSSSVQLMPGTLIRFGEGAAAHGIEGTAPNPSLSGAEAGITAPEGSRGRGTASGRSPRGSAAAPATKPVATPPPSAPAPF
jgi:multidrug efflux pump subunit AcrA (membrane-fusion protein)